MEGRVQNFINREAKENREIECSHKLLERNEESKMLLLVSIRAR